MFNRILASHLKNQHPPHIRIQAFCQGTVQGTGHHTNGTGRHQLNRGQTHRVVVLRDGATGVTSEGKELVGSSTDQFL